MLTKIFHRLIHAYYFEYQLFTETYHVFHRFMYIFTFRLTSNRYRILRRQLPTLFAISEEPTSMNTYTLYTIRLGGAYCYPHKDALCMRISDKEEICVGIRRRYFFQ